MTVGVVIPCRNEARWLGEVLGALAVQTMRPDEIVVVDDGSTDDTASIARRFSKERDFDRLRVIPGPERGVAAAVAAGVAALRTDIIVRLDGHCRPAPDYIERAVALVAQPEIGVAGGVWQIEAGAASREAEAIAIGVAHPMGSGGALYRRATLPRAVDVDTVAFGCFRRSLWTELGGFNQQLRSNEDYEFNYRVRLKGLRVVLDPSIRCTYYARSTVGEVARQYARYGWWKARMLLRHPASIWWRQLAPVMLVPALIAVLLGSFITGARIWWLLLAAYPAAVAIGAVHAAGARRKWSAAGWLVATFMTIHLSWSMAFWASLASAAVGRRQA